MKLSNTAVLHAAAALGSMLAVLLVSTVEASTEEAAGATLKMTPSLSKLKPVIGAPARRAPRVGFAKTPKTVPLSKSASEKIIGARKLKKGTGGGATASFKEKSMSSPHLLTSKKKTLAGDGGVDESSRTRYEHKISIVDEPIELVEPKVQEESARTAALLKSSEKTDRRYVRQSTTLDDSKGARRGNSGAVETGRRPARRPFKLKVTGPLIVDNGLKIDFDPTIPPLIMTPEGHEAELLPFAEKQLPSEFGASAKGVILSKGTITRPADVVHSGPQMITTLHTVGLGKSGEIENTIHVYDVMSGGTLFTQKHPSNNRLNLYASNNTLVVLEHSASSNKSGTALATIYAYGGIPAVAKSTATIPFSVSHVRFSEDSSNIAICGYTKSLVLVRGAGYYILDTTDVELAGRWLLFQPTLDQQYASVATLLLDTVTGVCRLACHGSGGCVEASLSRDALVWTRQSPAAHIVEMLDLREKAPVPIQVAVLPADEFLGPQRPCIFGSFSETSTILLMGRNGSLSLVNAAQNQFTVVYPDETEDVTTSTAYSNSPLVLRSHSSRNFVALRLQAHTSVDSNPASRTKLLSVGGDASLPDTRIFSPASAGFAPNTRFIPMPVEDGCVYAFNVDLSARYVVNKNLITTIEPIGETAQTAPFVTDLSSIGVQGTPCAFQISSDSTIFFLATRSDESHYIYIIDHLRRIIKDYQLNLRAASIVGMDAYSNGNILAVTLDNQNKLILSRRNQGELRCVNRLGADHRIVFADSSTAVIERTSGSPTAFQKGAAAKPGILFLDLSVANAKPFVFRNPDASFLMLEKSTVYLLVGKSKLLATFDVKTKVTTVKTLSPKLAHIRNAYFIMLHDNLLHLIGGDSTYKVVFLKLLELLYTCQIPVSDRQLAGSRVKFSRDASRIMVEQPAMHKLFHIVDPKFVAICSGSKDAIEDLRDIALTEPEYYNPQGLLAGDPSRQESARPFYWQALNDLVLDTDRQ